MHLLFEMLVISDDGWSLSLCSLRCAYSCSVQDGLHCLWWEMGGNLTQGISHRIVSSFLIFQLKIIFG